MTTRRMFELVAELLKEAKGHARLFKLMELQERFEQEFEKFGPGFNMKRFRAASAAVLPKEAA